MGLRVQQIAREGIATKTRKCIPISIPKSNLEGNQPLFNEAITSYTEIRNGVLMYTAGGGRGK